MSEVRRAGRSSHYPMPASTRGCRTVTLDLVLGPGAGLPSEPQSHGVSLYLAEAVEPPAVPAMPPRGAPYSSWTEPEHALGRSSIDRLILDRHAMPPRPIVKPSDALSAGVPPGHNVSRPAVSNLA